MRVIRTLSRRLRREDGFVFIYALLAIVIVLASAMAAYAAVDGDIGLSSVSSQQKQAYAAAQAGIQRYLFDLNQNSEFWTECVPTGTNWLFNPGDTVTPQSVPGSATEKYAVTLLPAAGQSTYTKCSTTNPVNSMIQTSGADAGTLRISATGYAGNQKRTVVAALREQSFLDYSYFTDFETSDPLLQVDDAFKASGDTTLEPPDECAAQGLGGSCGSNYDAALQGAQTQCSQYRFAGRDTDTAAGHGYGAGNFFRLGGTTFQCTQIQFAPTDVINGPFHTNDSALVCNSPTFGRPGHQDAVEFGTSPGTLAASSCANNPNFNGVTPTVSNLQIPATNTLSTVAVAPYVFTGTTCLALSTSGIAVGHTTLLHPSCEGSSPPPATLMAYPPNGVVYIKNGTCSLAYDVDNPSYTGNTGCGTVYIHGVDLKPLTIGTDDDIVIDGNLTYSNTTSSLLGLIATNFVRLYHPVGSQPGSSNSHGCTSSTSNATGSMSNPIVDAMILSLRHSFVVDQYDCGPPLGNLTLLGGIAQEYRGTVGTSVGTTTATGYIKNYNYDDRLKYEEPPHFLTPVEGAWKIQRQTECDTTGCSN